MLLLASPRSGAAAALPQSSGDPESAAEQGLCLLPALTPAGGYYTFLFSFKLINPISSGSPYAFFSAGKCHSPALLVNGGMD